MAILQHSTLTSAIVHEPKHISLNGTSATGNVITNSSSSTAVSEYRRLTQVDVDNLEVILHAQEFDGSVQQTHYIPATFAGDIVKWAGIVNIAVAAGSNTYELQINGTPVTGSAITFTVTPGSGGTAGDIVKASPSTSLTLAVDDALTIVNTSKANTETALDIRFLITVKRV